ncbi:MAG: SDR family oxidoreductase [Bacteriovoracaceae bacterium]|nr:SDR family oxidoreductase [Bacteriovoracaceae bacterium]
MKRILVSGGAGFLGSHLCEQLILQGNEVICIDNYFTGNKDNILHLRDYDKFELVRHDVTNPFMAEVEEIYHLACPASPIHYQFNPLKTLKTSFLGTMNMMGLAKRVKARILIASTSEVYGDPQVHPQREDYWGNVNPIGPRACYDEGKRVAESLAVNYMHQHGVDIRIMRIFNTYGPKMHPEDGRVVSNFINQALNGQNITVYGEGNQTRSFCYVSDLIEGMMKLMATNKYQGPVNLGNSDEFTILELANMVVDMTDSSSQIIFEPLPQDDPMQRRPDLTKAKQLLNWSPKIKLADGLSKTIEYFKGLYQ